MILLNFEQGWVKDLGSCFRKDGKFKIDNMGVNCAENNRVNSTKRVFISHASKDNEIISRFVDSILLLGMNLNSSVVAYTSREDTGVMPGESIPEFIQNNIACADVVLLMISEHFKKSEVCLNEMGAALALGKHIVQILLPNVSINTLGWLCSLDRAIKIDDSCALDSLYEIFEEKLGVKQKLSVWNRNKSDFISVCKSMDSPIEVGTLALVVESHEEDELGFLDYKDRFDSDVAMVHNTCGQITNAVLNSNNKLAGYASKIKNLNLHNPSTSQLRQIMSAVAYAMNELADVEETSAPLLRNHFFSMVDNAVIISTMVRYDNDQYNYDIVMTLLRTLSEARQSMVEMKIKVDELPNAEITLNKARKRLSNTQSNLIKVFDECITKSKELIGHI